MPATEKVRLDLDGAIAVVTNDNPDKGVAATAASSSCGTSTRRSTSASPPRASGSAFTGNLDRTSDKDVCQPAMRVGRRQELGWAATFLASPYARSGHTLVVDGANWQRRSLTNPPVVTVRDQMGRPPFGR